MANPPTTPEARLLTQAMQRHNPPWKAPRLARESGVGIDWVRAHLRGARSTGKGQQVEVRPDAVMLARLAYGLGNVTTDQLDGIGRQDASEALELLKSEQPSSADLTPLRRLIDIRAEIDVVIGELRAQG